MYVVNIATILMGHDADKGLAVDLDNVYILVLHAVVGSDDW